LCNVLVSPQQGVGQALFDPFFDVFPRSRRFPRGGKMRRSLLAFLALVTIVSVGCFGESTLDPYNQTGVSSSGGSGGGGGGAGTPDSAGLLDTASVIIFDNGYSPTAVGVSPGGTVTWVWTGNNAHGVTFDDATISPSTIQSVGTYTVRFPRVGIFSFYCTVHGRTVESGTVTVQ
ncbi:MAG: cupredoxin domain-containing protein, partial [Gemmatimonadaceae bacterium]